MSNNLLLNFCNKGKPITEFDMFIVGAPVRHLFMIETVRKVISGHGVTAPVILEVGSFFGASSLTWAFGCHYYKVNTASIICVDSWQPYLKPEENPVNSDVNKWLEQGIVFDIFSHNINTLPPEINVLPICGKSHNILPVLKQNNFDIVYLDADHSYGNVKGDILNAMPLVKDGGFLCGDDLNIQLYELKDKHYIYQNKNKDVFINPENGKTYHPGITLAVAETIGTVSSYGGFWLMQKKDGKWNSVEFNDLNEVYPDHFSCEKKTDAMNHLRDILRNRS